MCGTQRSFEVEREKNLADEKLLTFSEEIGDRVQDKTFMISEKNVKVIMTSFQAGSKLF